MGKLKKQDVQEFTNKVKTDLEGFVTEIIEFIKRHKKLIATALVLYAAYKFLFDEDLDN